MIIFADKMAFKHSVKVCSLVPQSSEHGEAFAVVTDFVELVDGPDGGVRLHHHQAAGVGQPGGDGAAGGGVPPAQLQHSVRGFDLGRYRIK